MPEYEENSEAETGGALRAQLEQALKDKVEAVAQATEFSKTIRTMQISNILGAKGINPKVASFVPQDVEGVEAIGAWLEENKDVFGSTGATTEVVPDVQAVEDPPSADTANARRLQDLSGSAGASTNIADFESRMKDAKSDQEVQEILVEAQKYVLAGS